VNLKRIALRSPTATTRKQIFGIARHSADPCYKCRSRMLVTHLEIAVLSRSPTPFAYIRGKLGRPGNDDITNDVL
jgi:hypothetical protein